MVARTLLAVALAATLLIGGVAATGAATPQDASPANDHQPDDAAPDDPDSPDDAGAPENGSADEAVNVSEPDRGNGSTPADVGPDGERGPPTDAPANVPDHVVQIHQTINDYLFGDLDDLGDALSGILGGDDHDERDDAPDETDGDGDEADAESEDADDSDDDADGDDSDD